MQKLIVASLLVMLMSGFSIQPTKSVIQASLPLSQIDSDKDGVNDDIDRCPKTLTNAVVDSNGCPFIQGPDTHYLNEIRIYYLPNQITVPKSGLEISENFRDFDFWRQLTTLASHIKSNPNIYLRIKGSASKHERTSEAERMQLSNMRALTVKNLLVQQFSVNQDKIFALGCSTNHPMIEETDTNS